MSEVRIKESDHSLTVPSDMYHLQLEVTAARRASGIEASLKEQQNMVKEQARELVSSLNLEDVSGEAIKPLSTPNVERNEERGKGRS